jgi:single-strand DNA-binding protein
MTENIKKEAFSNFSRGVICGSLNRDPHMEFTPQGTAVLNFSLTVNVTRGEKTETSYFDTIAFGAAAEKYAGWSLAKGNTVMMDGRWRQRRWTDAQQKKHSKTEFLVDSLAIVPADAANASLGKPKEDAGKEEQGKDKTAGGGPSW